MTNMSTPTSINNILVVLITQGDITVVELRNGLLSLGTGAEQGQGRDEELGPELSETARPRFFMWLSLIYSQFIIL